jgi:hypothetical protein
MTGFQKGGNGSAGQSGILYMHKTQLLDMSSEGSTYLATSLDTISNTMDRCDM